MTSKLKLFQIGSVVFTLLGLFHLLTHFGMTLGQKPPSVLKDMEAFRIDLLGEHNLLKFHNGFSIMMGFLLMAYGLQNFLQAKYISGKRSSMIAPIITASIAFAITVIFFHPLAYGMVMVSLLFYVVVLFQSR